MLKQFVDLVNGLSFAVHSNHLGSGIAEIMGALLVFLEKLLSIESGAIVSTIIPGFDAMPNWHPLLVHFPIALFPAFLILDSVGLMKRSSELRQVASYFLYLGTIAAIFVIFAGFNAAETIAHGSTVHSIMVIHELYGLIVTVLALVLTWWRYRNKSLQGTMANILHLSLSVLMCIFLTLGADLGGLMVYKYGVGVASIQPSVASHEHMQGT